MFPSRPRISSLLSCDATSFVQAYQQQIDYLLSFCFHKFNIKNIIIIQR